MNIINKTDMPFRDLDPTIFSRLLTDKAADELMKRLHISKPGNCLRVSTLPITVMHNLAHLLYDKMSGSSYICFLIKDNHEKQERWQVKATQLVALRNVEDKPLLVFVPPGLHTSAEDSFDVSTFTELDFSGLSQTLHKTALNQLPNSIQPVMKMLIERVMYYDVHPTDDEIVKYLLTVQQNGATSLVAGQALYQLGLIPDLTILDDSDSNYDFDARIKLNIQSRQTLADASETLLTRIYRLKLERGPFQAKLYSFLKDRTPEDAKSWGRAIAAEGTYQDLSLDNWPLLKVKSECLLYVHDLKLPVRRTTDSVTKIFNPLRTRSLTIAWETEPEFKSIAELDHFRIEVVNNVGSVMYESGRIGVKKNAVQKMSHSIKAKDLTEFDLQEELYYLRVRAYTMDGILLNTEDREDTRVRRSPLDPDSKRINETEEFLYLEEEQSSTAEDPNAIRNQVVTSYLEARLLVIDRLLNAPKRGEAVNKIKGLELEKAAWATSGSHTVVEIFNIRYNAQNSYSLPLSGVLANIERSSLALEDLLGRWHLNLLGTSDVHTTRLPDSRTTEPEKSCIPDIFLKARERLFTSISTVLETEAETSENISSTSQGMLISTVDLLPFQAEIEQYLVSYQSWLTVLVDDLATTNSVDRRAILLREVQIALDIDVVYVTLEHGMDHKVELRLLAPTHPLRLWWHMQYQRLIDDQLHAALKSDNPRDEFSSLTIEYLRRLVTRYMPQMLQDNTFQYYLDSGALTPFWQLYLPANVHDSRSISARLASLLSLQKNMTSVSSISMDELVDKIRRYLVQHPYVSTLKLNIFNPGDAQLIVDTLVELQKDTDDAKYQTRHLKYQIQLFSESGMLDDIGSAFEDLLNPNRQVSETQDAFTLASRNLLFPKLRFARNQLGDFKEHPELFSAHISLLLNLFPAQVSLEKAHRRGRSSFVSGLVQEPVTWFSDKGGQLTWLHQLHPGQGKMEVSASAVLNQYASLQASIDVENIQADLRPTVRLDLDLDAKSLLYQIHTTSDWVLTVDGNLGLEYFDSAPELERPIFVLDFTPQYLAAAGEHLILTTQAMGEVLNNIGPILEHYGINEGEGQEWLFFHLLRSLSGQLLLRLMSAPNQADEVISLALAQLFLGQYGLLCNRLVIPLDVHLTIFSGQQQYSPFFTKHSDLLMVEIEPESRKLVFHLLQVRLRYQGSGFGLEDEMEEQFAKVQKVLQERFDPMKPHLEKQMRVKELMTLLDFYLNRARRYRLIAAEIADQMSDFFTSLDDDYTLLFVRHGLIFDLSSDKLKETISASGTPFYSVGNEYISRFVQYGLRIMNTRTSHNAQSEALLTVPPVTEMQRDSSFISVREAFTTTAFGASSLCNDYNTMLSKVADDKYDQNNPSTIETKVDGNLPFFETHVEPVADPSSASSTREKASASAIPTDEKQSADKEIIENYVHIEVKDVTSEVEAPHVDVLVGDTQFTSQYGVLGNGSGRIVGLDLNGVNTISLFGVQGAGKSYTIGLIAEMATRYFPGVNQLRHPLATAIFHYHESQDYKPEFVSMVMPNNREDELHRLRTEFGAEPAALSEVLLLTSADKIIARRKEYPSIEVQSISFRSNELTARDWMFLMGAIGNQSLYITQISKIMRDYRDSLTIDNIRNGVVNSRLNETQKELAEMRLDFASEYISDVAPPLADHLKAGRLIIVDLRDELISKEQALGLFVVMLTIFAGVGSQGIERFNKLIVLDEAHKYMTGGDLTDQVVSIIRQMRHQGVSVLIASQDPPSLPSAVIELSSIILLHRFNSPNWLKHIQRSVVALHELTPGQLASLKPGEAYIWANKATEPLFSQKAIKIRMRPRLTLHGGATKTAENI